MGIDLDDPKKLTMLRSQIDRVPADSVVTSEFPTVGPEDRIADVLALMRDAKQQDVAVVEKGEYVGMASYSSILRKKSVTLDAKVRGIVRKLPALSPGTEITKIAELMVSTNSRQLPVVSGRKVVGIVERNTLTQVVHDVADLRKIKVWEIMSNPVDSVRPNDLMDDVLEMMIREDYRTVPVVEDANGVIGIVGMREIIDNNWKKDNKTIGDLEKSSRSQITVESIAATSVLTVRWDDDLSVAVDVMTENKISTVPVLDGRELVGVITEYDIVEMLSACREREMMFVQISGLDDGEKEMLDSVYARIEDMSRKISKMYKPESLTMHVSRYNDSGGNFKYSISARLFINGTAVMGKEVGWDLVKTATDLVEKLEDAVVSMKDSKVSFRKRKK